MPLSHAPVVRATMLIRRPVKEVFKAFTDPSVTSRFWFSRSTGPLVAGTTVTWYWDDYDASGEVFVRAIDEERRIEIEWPSPVAFMFESPSDNNTLVTISASGFTGTDDEQLAQTLASAEGFNLVLAGCKAWLEHGIELNLVADKSSDASSEGTNVHAEAHANGASTIPTITAFEQSPDRGQGLARDMAVRWALEEAGQPYEVRLVSFPALKEAEHRTRHPFGQIPTYEEGDLVLFESGAIVLHLAERHEGLLPSDPDARARAIMWMFAAVSTVEPQIVQREVALYLESDEAWHARRLPIIENRIRTRLEELSARLGDADWLDGEFSAGDLMMVQVLRRLKGSNLLEEFPPLSAYVARGEARPAFKRAFDAQRAVFTGKASGMEETPPPGNTAMPEHRIFSMPFSAVYPMYVQKAERKGRTKEEVDQIIRWLTGYDQPGLMNQIEQKIDMRSFFAEAPAMHPNRSLITGVICGVRVEEVEDPLMKKIRQLDKLVDELAKGKRMEKILRQSEERKLKT